MVAETVSLYAHEIPTRLAMGSNREHLTSPPESTVARPEDTDMEGKATPEAMTEAVKLLQRSKRHHIRLGRARRSDRKANVDENARALHPFACRAVR